MVAFTLKIFDGNNVVMSYANDFKNTEDFRKIEKAISKHKAKRVALQLPEGLKTKSRDIIDAISSLGADVLFFADPCFGACDIPTHNAKNLGCDIIIHFAHSEYIKDTDIPVIYIEYRSKTDSKITGILEKDIGKLKSHKSIGLITTIQHIDILPKIKETLEKNNIKAFIGKPKIAKYNGQVLGCDQSCAKDISDKVDCFLYIGSGQFHPLGVARSENKPVFMLDTEKEEIRCLDREFDKNLKKILLKKARFDHSKNIALVISTKKGQTDRNTAPVKEKLESLGKNVYVLVMDHISYDKMEGIGIDFIINTACPRLEEDLTFDRPILNWDTLKQYI